MYIRLGERMTRDDGLSASAAGNSEALFRFWQNIANRPPRCCLIPVLCLTAPGQGSQKAGMLAPWLELPGAQSRLDAWSASSGLDLERLGTTATLQDITDTAVTQPLVVASALLGAAELRRRGHLPADTIVAGHSIGESPLWRSPA